MGKRLIITEEEKKQIMRLYESQKNMSLGGAVKEDKDESHKDRYGFYNISYKDDGIVSSVNNTYQEGGGVKTTKSTNLPFNQAESLASQLDEIIAFTYYFGKPSTGSKLQVNVTSENGESLSESFTIPSSDSTKYYIRLNMGGLPENTSIDVSVVGDENNRLKIITKGQSTAQQPADTKKETQSNEVKWDDFKTRVEKGIKTFNYWTLFPKNYGDPNEIKTYTYPPMTYKGYKFDGAYPEPDTDSKGIQSLQAYATQVEGDVITFKTRLGNSEYTFKIKP